MSGFLNALEYVLGEEGGLADHPQDRGGRTNLGISTPVWNAWRDRLHKPGQSVDACTRNDAEVIYHRGFWMAARCDGLPWPLSLCVFDAAVQHDPRDAVKILQRALGVKDDGILGPVTAQAIAKADKARLVRSYLFARLAFYRADMVRSKEQRVFAPSWIGRILHLRARCLRDHPEIA